MATLDQEVIKIRKRLAVKSLIKGVIGIFIGLGLCLSALIIKPEIFQINFWGVILAGLINFFSVILVLAGLIMAIVGFIVVVSEIKTVKHFSALISKPKRGI